MLRLRHFLLPLLLVFIIPTAARADRLEYGFGWQHTGPVSGFSLRIPVGGNLAIQPLFSIAMSEKGSGVFGHANYGLRLLKDLPSLGLLLPYAGAGFGRSTSISDGVSRITQGFQVFLGVDYPLGNLRPSLELALGEIGHSDGTYYLGTMFNLGLLYYF